MVPLKGVDVYDPTTGEIRITDTGQIVSWDHEYCIRQEVVTVRHCYFAGGNVPYRRLKTALKAEIDEDVWASLYSSLSRPRSRGLSRARSRSRSSFTMATK